MDIMMNTAGSGRLLRHFAIGLLLLVPGLKYGMAQETLMQLEQASG